MSKRLFSVLVALTLTGLAIGTATVSAQRSTRELNATLRGAKEVPGPGDAQGRGTFHVEFRSATRLCYTLRIRGTQRPVAAHIHNGGKTVAGPVFIDLQPNFRGANPRVSRKCVTTTAANIRAVRSNPGGFYVNVHTPQFPAGAARGQLRRHA